MPTDRFFFGIPLGCLHFHFQWDPWNPSVGLMESPSETSMWGYHRTLRSFSTSAFSFILKDTLYHFGHHFLLFFWEHFHFFISRPNVYDVLTKKEKMTSRKTFSKLSNEWLITPKEPGLL